MNELAVGPAAWAEGDRSIALGAGAHATCAGQVVIKLDGVEAPLVLELSDEVREAFREAVMKASGFRGSGFVEV